MSKKNLAIILCCLEAEKNVDVSTKENYYSEENHFFFFRILHFFKIYQRFPTWAVNVFFFCFSLSFVLLGLFYPFWILVRNCFKRSHKNLPSKIEFLKLNFCSHYRRLELDGEHESVFWFHKNSLLKEKYPVDISSFFALSDVNHYFRIFFSTIFELIQKKSMQFFCYLSMVPDLIIVLMVLNKVSPDRVSWANHYDRWSYLFDRVFTRSINTLYQHGIFTTQVGRFSKLQSIHRVVLKWHASEKIVRQLLKDPAKTIFEVHAEKLLFQKVGENKRSIFVVGRNFDLDGFKYLLVKLCDQPYLDKVYFKSHPLITNFSIKGLNKIEMVDVLIDVPLYISYHSSLALDLQEHGKNVIFTDGKETSQVLKDIESFFE